MYAFEVVVREVVGGLNKQVFYVAAESMPRAILKAEKEGAKAFCGDSHADEVRCLGLLYKG